MASRLRRLANTVVPFPLACWYFGMLLPTLAFKYLQLDLSGPVGPLALLFANDFAEVGLLVTALFVVGHLLLGLRLSPLVFGSVLLCVLAGGANYICHRQLDRPLTLDVLGISVSWVVADPRALGPFVTPKRLAALPAAVTWALAPVLATRWNARPVDGRSAPGFLVRGAVAASLAVWPLGYGMAAGLGSGHSTLLPGYWTAAVTAFLGPKETDPSKATVPPQAQIENSYRRLVFPRDAARSSAYLLGIPDSARRPRHLVIVSLETAPRKYYPITDRTELPVFHRMSQRAVVSDRHYATGPMSATAIYSIVTGTYPRPGKFLHRFGRFEADGLARVLVQRGYEATFIDSFRIGWGGRWDYTDDMLLDLGFTAVLDQSRERGSDDAEEAERWSFERAVDRVTSAASRERKALVYVATALGHYPWGFRRGEERRSAREHIASTCAFFDDLFGRFLRSLEARGLGDEVIVVVTGDHGLRFRNEFQHLGEEMAFGDLAFNVPLLIYGPSLFPGQIRLPYVTSHVDIMPTLLDLVGVERAGSLHHGHNVLDRRLEERITFLLSGDLRQVDGFHWGGFFYTARGDTRQVTARSADRSSFASGATLPDLDVWTILERGKGVFETTAAFFLQRGAKGLPRHSPTGNPTG